MYGVLDEKIGIEWDPSRVSRSVDPVDAMKETVPPTVLRLKSQR